LDEALIWDHFLRTYGRTPEELKAVSPYWMPECLLIVGAARADAERDAAARD
jgi:hypothetical protein